MDVVDRRLIRIFRHGSRTYFWSSLFFPREVREDVFVLYSFVRKADDLVDVIPQRVGEFEAFKDSYHAAMEGAESGDVVIDSFVSLMERRQMDREWTDAFLQSMEMDLHRSSYETLAELDTYLYGSSEVIGLFMAKVLDLDPVSYPHARYLGKAMQYVNFIRDVAEDLSLSRSYFPQEELRAHGLSSLRPEEVAARPTEFKAFMHSQIDRYWEWQRVAEKGFRYIPKRSLIPIATASEMYKWTSRRIRTDPFIVYRQKVKPSIPRVVGGVVTNALRPVGHWA